MDAACTVPSRPVASNAPATTAAAPRNARSSSRSNDFETALAGAGADDVATPTDDLRSDNEPAQAAPADAKRQGSPRDTVAGRPVRPARPGGAPRARTTSSQTVPVGDPQDEIPGDAAGLSDAVATTTARTEKAAAASPEAAATPGVTTGATADDAGPLLTLVTPVVIGAAPAPAAEPTAGDEAVGAPTDIGSSATGTGNADAGAAPASAVAPNGAVSVAPPATGPTVRSGNVTPTPAGRTGGQPAERGSDATEAVSPALASGPSVADAGEEVHSVAETAPPPGEIEQTAVPEEAPARAPELEPNAGSRRLSVPASAAARTYSRAVKALAEAVAASPALSADEGPVAPTAGPVAADAPDPTPDAKSAAPAVSARATAVLRALGVPSVAKVPTVDGVEPGLPAESPAAVAVARVAAAASAGQSGQARSDLGAQSGRRETVSTASTASLSAATIAFAIDPAVSGSSSTASAAGASTVPAQAPTTAAQPDVPVTTQVVKAVTLAWRDGVGEARIRLTPEHLGEVVVSLKVERGQVVAHVDAETTAARGWIESHQEELRDGLSSQGLRLDELVVTADGRRQQQSRDDSPYGSRRPPVPARADEESPRFEVNV